MRTDIIITDMNNYSNSYTDYCTNTRIVTLGISPYKFLVKSDK